MCLFTLLCAFVIWLFDVILFAVCWCLLFCCCLGFADLVGLGWFSLPVCSVLYLLGGSWVTCVCLIGLCFVVFYVCFGCLWDLIWFV